MNYNYCNDGWGYRSHGCDDYITRTVKTATWDIAAITMKKKDDNSSEDEGNGFENVGMHMNALWCELEDQQDAHEDNSDKDDKASAMMSQRNDSEQNKRN